MRGLAVRQITPEDLPAAGRLAVDRSSLLCGKGPWKPEEAAETIAFSEEFCFAALLRKKLLGFILGRRTDSGQGEILRCCVLPVRERFYAGRELIRHMEKAMKRLGINEIISVQDDDETEPAFFEYCGFSSTNIKEQMMKKEVL